MSGICGLFHPNRAPVDETDIATMTASLEQRGPDGSGRWRDGPVGFGHTLLATTPESLIETQPYLHAESGCVIVADARLDYRDELLAALGLEATGSRGDAELILRAYLTWGEDCLARIFGDFAFAIWDPRNQALFCARDRFGARPFYYHFADRARFVFASDARSIVTLPQVPFAIDEGRIADFIVEQLEWIDYTSTFYEGVCRLPPAHKALVSASGMQVSEYWDPSPGPVLDFRSDADYVDAFREVFLSAVRERLRVPESRVGSMLSGGMDSGSVTAVARELLSDESHRDIRVYSLARRRDADCLESQRIYATLDHLGVDGIRIIADETDDLVEPSDIDLAEPFDGQLLFLKAIYEAARRDGLKVVLDGAAGDIVLGAGAYIPRLMRRGRFRTAWREVVGEQAFWGLPGRGPEFARYLASALAPAFVKALLRNPRQRRQEREYVQSSLISPEFAERIDIEARCERLREMFPALRLDDPGLERLRKIRPNLTAGRERYARIAASAGIEGRDPFTDQRVVEYCARLPDRQLARDGWPKFLLRQVMAGMLPGAVRWGREKPHIGGLYNEACLRREIARGRVSLEGLLDTLEPYVDATALRAAWSEFESGGNAEPVHSAHILSNWLQQTVMRPVV